ncbi:Protein of unknown function (DUF3311) [Streptoalloteichus tenebrarius]|uniref:DUF3311 domain-containing protein n=1 Tax=Streptoalloteichus tenebrarius (strain ATCC 17920 / DSM 40477 / JCM 4838 / CBS 697.72 / NBRC 16177 / NCIMB 11028 / NRRL B-12390 / A12253. 1 / ISP 5477) TaxID=1933 RepID=A0ABT1I2C0_STRSD|nr:DUF3311 domain-containing protein [Streptoalloteichus tenebrarius]MCP2261928.1 Protein of unknown function (DUF3311) [Streptoalloteichus tenebrarius]BFF02080.1 hypothetical protein GCM10020241_37550 [Streptoalloteichus tenebrarius]
MSTGSPPRADHGGNGLRWNAWNLLLLVPLLMLVTAMFNQDQPRLFGLPFFYWFQFLFVPLGVLCVGLVYVRTRDEPVRTDQPDRLSVDDLDSATQHDGNGSDRR